jgi:hypothetical protein
MGTFVVSRRPDDNLDILFQPRHSDDPIPEDHLTLKDEVEHTLTVLRSLFPNGGPRFEGYYQPLLALAQVGLAAETPQPEVARRALNALKQQVVTWEGGGIKNRYMKQLGACAALLAAPAAVGALLLLWAGSDDTMFARFLAVWGGCMAGVWLSFGARKTAWTFDDLHMPERDRLEPLIRLVFAGLLTIIIALSFSTETVVVAVGTVNSAQVNSSYRVALLVGMLCGFSEQALSSTVARHAGAWLASPR